MHFLSMNEMNKDERHERHERVESATFMPQAFETKGLLNVMNRVPSKRRFCACWGECTL